MVKNDNLNGIQCALLSAIYYSNHGNLSEHNPKERIRAKLPKQIKINGRLLRATEKEYSTLRAKGYITSKTGRTKSWYITREGIQAYKKCITQ